MGGENCKTARKNEKERTHRHGERDSQRTILAAARLETNPKTKRQKYNLRDCSSSNIINL